MLKKTFTIAGFDLFPEVYTGVFLVSLEGLNSHDLRYANQFRSPANKCYFEIDEFLEVK